MGRDEKMLYFYGWLAFLENIEDQMLVPFGGGVPQAEQTGFHVRQECCIRVFVLIFAIISDFGPFGRHFGVI